MPESSITRYLAKQESQPRLYRPRDGKDWTRWTWWLIGAMCGGATLGALGRSMKHSSSEGWVMVGVALEGIGIGMGMSPLYKLFTLKKPTK